jgi:hypothetical protein
MIIYIVSLLLVLLLVFRILSRSNQATNSSNRSSTDKQQTSRFMLASSGHLKNSVCVIFLVWPREFKRMYAFLCASRMGPSVTFSIGIIHSADFIAFFIAVTIKVLTILGINHASRNEKTFAVFTLLDGRLTNFMPYKFEPQFILTYQTQRDASGKPTKLNRLHLPGRLMEARNFGGCALNYANVAIGASCIHNPWMKL